MTTQTAFASFLASTLLIASSSAEIAWPQFRGPAGDGSVPAGANLPMKWSEDENITWKTEIPGRAWSTPVIGNNQVWVTNANEAGTQLSAVCLDFRTGEIIHDKVLFKPANPEPLGNPVNGYGSPSAILEENAVYIHFGSYGTACLDPRTADVLWERTDLPCQHYRGPGSSPFLWNDLLILTMDGVDVQYLVALDKKTGKTVWKTDRGTDFKDLDAEGKPKREGDLRKAYTTPIIVETGGQTWLVSVGAKAAYAYDPKTGKEIWKVLFDGYSNASMPVANDTHLFLNTGFGKPDILAVRIDPEARGDITESHVDWKTNDRTPQKPSPLLTDDGILIYVNDGGIATACDATTGEQFWSERLGGKFSASPIIAGDRAYIPNEMGETFVFSTGKKFEILAENKLDKASFASAAVSGDSILIRTTEALYRID